MKKRQQGRRSMLTPCDADYVVNQNGLKISSRRFVEHKVYPNTLHCCRDRTPLSLPKIDLKWHIKTITESFASYYLLLNLNSNMNEFKSTSVEHNPKFEVLIKLLIWYHSVSTEYTLK